MSQAPDLRHARVGKIDYEREQDRDDAGHLARLLAEMQQRFPDLVVVRRDMADYEPLLTIQDVAKRFHKPVNTIYKWRTMGLFCPGHKVGKSILFKESDVMAWFEEQREDDGGVPNNPRPVFPK